MTKELKPCPWCKKRTYVVSYDTYVWFVECENDCKASLDSYDTKEEAIEAWNKRV